MNGVMLSSFDNKKVWEFEGKSVDIKGTIDEPYFNGKQVAEILGYIKTNEALREHVDDKDKKP